MRILAIDTSGLVASAAVTDGEKVLAELTLNYQKTHSQTLMPIVKEVMEQTQTNADNITSIAVACGPGSFTGLRIGVAAAKGLAYAYGVGIIPVPTLDGLAYNMAGCNSLVVPVMDARRSQVYTAIYENGVERLSEHTACDINEIVSQVKKISQKAVFVGDGVPVFKETILQNGFSVAPVTCIYQRAACIGVLAASGKYSEINGNDVDIMYLRKSQAEREKENEA